MSWKRETKLGALLAAVFVAAWFLPVGYAPFDNAVQQSLLLVKDYARRHVLLCLVPALFIAGGIAAFISQASVMRYLGPKAGRLLAYGVASVSGTVLAVCSCTVLPLFAGIYRMGAGLGPASAFLYAGPAINVLAIILTARVLGLELGIARAVGAVGFSVIIGLAMQFIFRKEEQAKVAAQAHMPVPPAPRPLWRTAVTFAAMVGILVVANWGRPTHVRAWMTEPGGTFGAYVDGELQSPQTQPSVQLIGDDGKAVAISSRFVREVALLPRGPAEGLYLWVYNHRFLISGVLLVGLLLVLPAWYKRPELGEWGQSTWGYAKLILPLLLGGVLVAGFLFGSPEGDGIIPRYIVDYALGGNSLRANLLASVAGALMYFATLTEVPIVQGLMKTGMGKGPALALLLAGPALSLPSMLVLRGIMGTRKTLVYVSLVVVMSTIAGLIFGALCP